jgi:hypothetical protein
MSFSDRVEELNQEIGATVERAVSELRRQLTERLRESSEQILRHVQDLAPSLPSHFLGHEHVAPFADEAKASARQAAFAELRDGLVAIDGARSQTAVLTALLGAAGRFAARSAVLLVRGGEVRGWGAQGFGDGATPPDIRSLAFPAPGNGAWGQVTQGEGAVRLAASECAEICSRLESPLPHDGALVPLILRDQLAALLYADSGYRDQALNVEALQTLTYVAAQAIELLPLRERASTATLQLQDGHAGDAAHAVAEETAPMPAPPAVHEEAAAAEPHVEAQPEEPPPAPAALAAAPAEPQPEPAWQTSATSEVSWAPPTPIAPIAEDEPTAAFPEELPELPDELPEVEATPAWEEEPAPWAAPASEPEPAAPQAAEPAPAPRPEETVLLQRPSFEPPLTPSPPQPPVSPEPEPTYPRPVAPLAPGPAGFETSSAPSPGAPAAEPERSGAAGTPEVRPPSDVDGPGWAFATTRVPVSPDDAELHESARRLARLLVSEIKLYNEDQVEEGRRNRDLYERLKEDIDRSRQMYEERVEPRVWKSTDYFYQELVRILAAGDSRALGI